MTMARLIERFKPYFSCGLLGMQEDPEGGYVTYADHVKALKQQQDDYEEVLADKRRLTRALDVLMNGDNAAKQASLCDIVGSFEHWKEKLLKAERERIAVMCDGLHHKNGKSIAAAIRQEPQ